MSDRPKVTLQQFGFQDSNYERPNQKWVCGRLGEGCPCHIGPNNKGDCLATFECQPNRKGDRWDCTRPANRGGKCEKGPSPDGTCCQAIPKCQPVRNIRAKRGAFVMWCVGLTVGLLAIVLFSESRMKFIQPGELSHVHGQVFKDAGVGQACATCHTAAHSDDPDLAAGGTLPDAWASAAFSKTVDMASNAKCLKCHQRHPGLKDNASDPHSLDPKLLASASEKETTGKAPLRWMFASLGPDVPKTDAGQLACATCHKEHRGEHHNLTALDSNKCQSCHQTKFDSFSKGHPEFKQFPYDRRTRLKFDHARHEQMHFKSAKAQFNCSQCHRVDATSEHINVRSFEQSCSQCHGDSMRKFEKGIPVIRLPGMDLPSLNEFSQTSKDNPWLGPWPLKADYGLNPPTFTPFMKLLLSADDEVVKAMSSLPPTFDYGDLTEASAEHKKAVIRIGWGVKELMFELSRNGQEALRTRLEKVLGEEINNDRLAELTGQVPASLLTSVQKQWFPELLVNVPLYRNGTAIPGRPAVKPPPPPKPKDPPKPKPSDDDLFGDDEPAEDGLFEPDPPKEPVDDALFDEDPPKKPVSDDLFADDPPAKKADAGDDDLFADDPPAKKQDDDLFADDGDDKAADDDLFSDDGDDSGDKKSDDDGGLFDDDGGDDLFADDGDSPPPVKDETPKVAVESVTPLPIEQRVPGGGWYLDEKDFALRYTPMGHGNAFLRQWLTSTADASKAGNAAMVQGMFDTLGSTAGAACMKCHSVDGTNGGSKANRMVNWNAKTPLAGERGFVKFSHRPHLNISELRNCRSCHQIEAQDVLAQFKGLDPHNIGGQVGFKMMSRASCSNCHQPKLAGDSCTKCHNYHIGEAPRWRHKMKPMKLPPAGVATESKPPAKDDSFSQGE